MNFILIKFFFKERKDRICIQLIRPNGFYYKPSL